MGLENQETLICTPVKEVCEPVSVHICRQQAIATGVLSKELPCAVPLRGGDEVAVEVCEMAPDDDLASICPPMHHIIPVVTV